MPSFHYEQQQKKMDLFFPNKKDCRQAMRLLYEEGLACLQKNFVTFLSDPTQVEPKLEEISAGNKIPVAHLKGESYQFLVHAVTPMKRFNQQHQQNKIAKTILEHPNAFLEDFDTVGNPYISATFIQNEKYGTWGLQSDSLLFGFSSLEPEEIHTMGPNDLGSDTNHMKEVWDSYQEHTVPIMTPEQLLEQTSLINEVIISRSRNGNKIKPDFLVCFDQLNPQTIRASSELNLPIYIIHREFYKKRESKKEELLQAKQLFISSSEIEKEETHQK